ncbi:CRISPR-associated helicase Cas3' [Nocardia sp. NPDC004085]
MSVGGFRVRRVGVERAAASCSDSRWNFQAAEVERWLGALWGKSAGRAGGRRNLLLQHLFDTAAVAELIWDFYLAESVRVSVDNLVATGDGRRLFVWLCGIHDWGKATPAFQHVDSDGADAVRAAGLGWDRFAVSRHRWRHDKAGAAVAIDVLAEAGWAQEQRDWLWPLIAGHHGTFPSLGELTPGRMEKKLRGVGEWEAAQRALVQRFTTEVGFGDVGEVAPVVVPGRALQLQLSGFVVMADWIASDEIHFPGVDDLAEVGIDGARARAAAAWAQLGLRRGWGSLPVPGVDDFVERFGESPRGSQRATMACAARMPCAGLMVVEAPMGEGKTKAALLAAEILAARFGMDGVFVGMPTQATCDPMFTNVRRWLSRLDPELADQVALLHGKRRFNPEWQQLLAGYDDPDATYRSVGEDEYGLVDPYSNDCVCATGRPQRSAPAEWFLGSKRGLLAPFAVGTIDQLLLAATRTKHVMLRMAGLAGKVVVLDEVHAADIYMSQFLEEGLRWLAQAGVPVVLLSATLTPRQHQDLIEAYLAGARGAEHPGAYELPRVQGYPRITTAWVDHDAAAHVEIDAAIPWRTDALKVAVEVLAEPDESAGEATSLARLLGERLADGGCVLVIRNTVARAQNTFEQLRKTFGGDVRLLHARMHVRHRADRTAECLELLGPPGPDRKRPRRLILVATQLAEQSFDVDVDLLVTDLAPMDLLLQRIGRMHRHLGVRRPERLRTPTVVVTGFTPRTAGAPQFVAASERIYGRWPLLRSAAAVAAVGSGCWAIPAQVPELVAAAYASDGAVLGGWESAVAQAFDDWVADRRKRADAATRHLLTRFGEHGRPTLAGLHRMGGADVEDEEVFVRDGDKTVEAVLVRRDGDGYRAMNGRWLGTHGEASPDLVDDVLGGTVRLPHSLTHAATEELKPLDGWRDHPWLRYGRALILDGDGAATVGPSTVRYDDTLGLIVS